MVVMAKIALKPDDTWHSDDMLQLTLDAVLPHRGAPPIDSKFEVGVLITTTVDG